MGTDSVFDSLMNNDFTISREVSTSDGHGGWEKSWVPFSSVRGRLRPMTSAERVQAQQDTRSITHVLYVDFSVDIRRGDKVTGAGLTVDVDAVREPSQAMQHLEVDCIERQVDMAEQLAS